MIETRVFRTASDLQSLQTRWNHLVEQSLNNTVFLTWEWVSAWIESYVTEHSLLVIAVLEDDRLRAVAPLWVDRRPQATTLRFLGSGEVCSDYLDFIVDSQDSPTWIGQIWSELTGPLKSEWNVFDYSDSLADSSIRAEVLRLATESRSSFHFRILAETVCPYLALPRSVDDFAATLSSSRRYTLSYSRKHLSKHGELAVHVCREEAVIEREMKRLEELHTRNWRARGEAGAFASERQRRFNLKVAQNLFAAGRLHLCRLQAGDQFLGTFLGFLYAETMSFYIMSVELSSQKRVNAGDVLLAECIYETIHRGGRQFDFLRGGEAYKYRWTQTERHLVTYRIYNRDFRARLQSAYDAMHIGMRRAWRGFFALLPSRETPSRVERS